MRAEMSETLTAKLKRYLVESHSLNTSRELCKLLLPDCIFTDSPEPIKDRYVSEYNIETENNNPVAASKLGTFFNNEGIILLLQTKKSINARVKHSNLIGKILKNSYQFSSAIVITVSEDDKQYRFSLVQLDYNTEKTSMSSAKRYSYILGPEAKLNTPSTHLFKIDEKAGIPIRAKTEEELLGRFSLDVVNKEFYTEIQKMFIELVGGKIKNKTFDPIVLRPIKEKDSKIKEEIKKEVAIRLIGRLIFCWFLKQKKPEENSKYTLIDDSILSNEAVSNHKDYYSKIIEPLFFEVLNKPVLDRKLTTYQKSIFKLIPYLNGGLFESREHDYYRKGTGEMYVPDQWFSDLFEFFDRYHFTIDENSSVDIEVSIDPEMLGTIFENLLGEINPDTEKQAKKATGSFYTPRKIVDYMVDESLKQYLHTKTEISLDKLQALISYNLEDDIGNNFSDDEKRKIIKAISECKIIDPACGSGAFPIGVLQKIIWCLEIIDPGASLWMDEKFSKADNDELLDNIKTAEYFRKLGVIRDNIFGVDIQSIAVEISKLRCFLTLIVEANVHDDLDETKNRGIEPLPNLEFKFVCANSLISLPERKLVLEHSDEYEDKKPELQKLRNKYFNATSEKRKLEIKTDFISYKDSISPLDHQNETYNSLLSTWDPFNVSSQSDFFDPDLMFDISIEGIDGFDIVIGNPPYVSTKGRSDKEKKDLKKQFGFVDDLYSHFTFLGFNILSDNGMLSYITSKTFWTIQSKKNMREKLLNNEIITIMNTSSNTFEAMVDTCVFIAKKNEQVDPNRLFNFSNADIESNNDIQSKINHSVSQNYYLNTVNSVFFIPTSRNKQIHKRFNNDVKTLMDTWWSKIRTSEEIEKNSTELQNYRDSLKPGDVTLLGLISDGGVGLQTGDNGMFVGYIDSYKNVEKIKLSRVKKLFEFLDSTKLDTDDNNIFHGLGSFESIKNFVDQKSEQELWKILDNLKLKYGRRIFGKGFMYRIIAENMIANLSELSEHEKKYGIKGTRTFVPYDKGDKEGNRWFLQTPYYIDWSEETVSYFKENSGKKGTGMPVLRNPQFYFKEGFCWSDIHTLLIKSRLNSRTAYDVKSMSLFPLNKINSSYIIVVLNSLFASHLLDTFINNTSTCQINDMRQFPIIVPSDYQISEANRIAYEAIEIQNQKFSRKISENEADQQLLIIQEKVDSLVNEIYGID